jgi:two-component system KDP operon response regulator KdpE
MRVLLVDDDETIAYAVSESLRAEGIRVDSLEEGRKAIGSIVRHRPDVVILDIGLRDIDGIALANIIRQSWPDLPIIIASGRLTSDGLAELLETPRTAMLQKPYPIADLVSAIHRLARPRAAEAREAARAHRR